MIIPFLLTEMITLLVVPDAVRATEAHHRALQESIAPAVVYLSTTGGSGSGFFVSAEGHVLTNAHVVGTGQAVDAVLLDGRRFSARVIERGADDTDLALLKIDGGPFPFLPITGGPRPRTGAFVAAVGHGEGAVWTFNVGIVSNAYGSLGRVKVLQTQIPLNPGNSGGPVVDATGRVVAVVTAGVVGANSLNFAIPIDTAPLVLSSLAPHCACVSVRAPEGAAVFLDGVRVGAGPRVTLLPDGAAHEVSCVVDGKMKTRKVDGAAAVTVHLSE